MLYLNKIKKILLTALILFTFSTLISAERKRPKIVIGMVVDQMCWDYLYRYNSSFCEGGFKRLLSEGFNCENTRINYLPAVTAIGHTSIYTGSVPSIHGIAGNDFYEDSKKYYCTGDDSVKTVGAEDSKAGRMSPRNLKTTTICDELRIATNFRNKVIGIALKDRGAILPAGHSANAAYWFDDKSENFISSTYYMKDLPNWLKEFNNKKLAYKYCQKDWDLLLDKEEYKNSSEDANHFELPWIKGEETATLPLNLKKLYKEYGASIIRSTPFGNSLTLELAKACIDGENLGMSMDEEISDFLTISLSSTDYIGHRYGTFARETQDCYLRLDRDLEDFFNFLDKKFGEDNYLFFITADHAAAHNINFLKSKKIKAEPWPIKKILSDVNDFCKKNFAIKENLIISLDNYQVHFNKKTLDSLNLEKSMVYNQVADFLEQQDLINYAIVAKELNKRTIPEPIRTYVENGYNRKRSGEIFIILEPASYAYYRKNYPEKGTSHSVWAPYDTHIPLIFMGWNISKGHLYEEVHMTDIAASIAFLLKTQVPNGCIGKPIESLLEEDDD